MKKNTDKICRDTMLIPFYKDEGLCVELPDWAAETVNAAIKQARFCEEKGEVCTLSVLTGTEISTLVLVGIGSRNDSVRERFAAFSAGVRVCADLKKSNVTILLDNLGDICSDRELALKLCEAPKLVNYKFDRYKSGSCAGGFKEIDFICGGKDFEEILREAEITAESTILARNLVNTPSCDLTPEMFADIVLETGENSGFTGISYDNVTIQALDMKSFTAVAKGAPESAPRLVVMKYKGAGEGKPLTALVGKGVMYDSGGYSLKTNEGMGTMYGDMGGAAAVLGAVRAAAMMKLPVNVVGIVAACVNRIGDDAYVPGDIIGSMNGKTVEILSTDAEGRLTLIDAITYAIREQKADRVIDIATLTGAAKGAVGNKTSAALTNSPELFALLEKAAENSAEKVWRLDLDKELLAVITNSRADIKNSVPGNTAGGGTILGGLFIHEFVEGKPWIHIDCAPVNMTSENLSYCVKGATGYGSSLLYNMLKEISKN